MTIYDHRQCVNAGGALLFFSSSFPFFVGALFVPFVVAVDHTQQTHKLTFKQPDKVKPAQVATRPVPASTSSVPVCAC